MSLPAHIGQSGSPTSVRVKKMTLRMTVYISVTHVQRETLGCCCHGCCSCSPLVPGQESSDFVKKDHHEPAEWRSGSPLQRKQISVKTHRLLCEQVCFPNANHDNISLLSVLLLFTCASMLFPMILYAGCHFRNDICISSYMSTFT